MSETETTTSEPQQFEAVAHVLWEMPFPLRLPAHAFPIWEPAEGLAAFAPHPDVGELAWKRKCSFLSAAEVFADPGPGHDCYPLHHYAVACQQRSGKTLRSALLTAGASGGFSEARPYATANIFLCLRHASEYTSDAVLQRASDALNNLLDVYRFLTMDPLVRSVRIDHDCYYTLVSTAILPEHLRHQAASAVLSNLGELQFATDIGRGRAHRVGLNSFDDLMAGDVLPDDVLQVFDALVRSPHRLEVFHQLIFSAIRRLKRKEHALAVIDAESALESLVATLVFECLRETHSREQAEAEMAGAVHTLQRRFEYLDRVAKNRNPQLKQGFLGSDEEALWRRALYGLRNRISHEGLRVVGFVDAKAGLVGCLRAADRIQGLCDSFRRPMSWSGEALNLGHLEESAGRLSRLFEA